MTGSAEKQPTVSQPTDCPETGMLVWLSGVQLEVDDPQAYYGTAREMGIFSSNVTEARTAALQQRLTAIHTPTMRDRLTAEGRKHLRQQFPAETRQLVAKTILSHIVE